MIKNFLKPSKIKIVIAILFLGFSFFYEHVSLAPPGLIVEGLDHYHGFPLPYLIIGYYFGHLYMPATRILPIGLLVNIIFWYFISCLIIFIYEKLKRKSRL